MRNHWSYQAVLNGLLALLLASVWSAGMVACSDSSSSREEDAAQDSIASDVGVDQTSDLSTPCASGADCASGVCELATGVCVADTCGDGAQNGDESDVDCGGSCDPCADGGTCSVATDCAGGACSASGVCAAPTCNDGVKNRDESDADCGGTYCAPCGNGRSCGVQGDCQSDICLAGVCVAPGCQDSIKDGDETDVDCGGGCPVCLDGDTCDVDADCAGLYCVQVNKTCATATCTDGVSNGEETGIDCGGAVCDACGAGQTCTGNGDCDSDVCANGVCAQATCQDSIRNQGESAVDCGGSNCAACSAGKTCQQSSDCASSYCIGGTCGTATNCLELLTADPTLTSGDYNVDVDGSGGALPVMAVTCDMETDGGGWMLVLNYLHLAGSNPPLLVRTDALPRLVSTTLGDDESADPDAWGHAGNALLAAIPFAQTMWFAQSSGHDRVIHFRNDSTAVRDYLVTGTGSAGPDIFDPGMSTLLERYHRATLPLYTNNENSVYADRGDYAMTEFPFYSDPDADMGNPRAHWGIHGLGDRWEVDDSTSNHSTHHQVWVRPDPCADSKRSADESDVDCGGICGGCTVAAACNDGGDCASGVCSASVCGTYKDSCLAIRVADPTTPDGSYTIALGGALTDVYCDMTTDGGGWTLMAKFNQRAAMNTVPQATWDAYFRNASWIDGAAEATPSTPQPHYDAFHVESHDWAAFMTQDKGYELRQQMFRGASAYAFDVAYDFTYNGYTVQNATPALDRAWTLTNRDVLRDDTNILWNTPAGDTTVFWLPIKEGVTGSVFTACGSFEFAASGCTMTNLVARRYGNAGIIGNQQDGADPAGAWAPHMNANPVTGYDVIYIHQATPVYGVSGQHVSLLYWVREDTCVSGAKDGAETDVDCGGATCGGCAPTDACAVDTDCASGICTNGACFALQTSCNAIRLASPDTPDGDYTIDTDGAGTAANPVEVTCDMTNDGGGWTRVVNIRGNSRAHADETLALGDLTQPYSVAKLSDADITRISTVGYWRYNCGDTYNGFVRNASNTWTSALTNVYNWETDRGRDGTFENLANRAGYVFSDWQAQPAGHTNFADAALNGCYVDGEGWGRNGNLWAK